MDKVAVILGEAFGRWLALLSMAVVFCYPLMLLWNTFLVPAVTVLMPITAMQAWGMIVFLYMVRPRGARNGTD